MDPGTYEATLLAHEEDDAETAFPPGTVTVVSGVPPETARFRFYRTRR